MAVGSGSSTNILRFSYNASGNVVAVDYSTDNGSTFNTYYYLRNAQNDIVKLIDNSGTVGMSMTKKPNSTTSSHVTTILKLDGGLALNLMLIMVDLTKVPDYWVTMYTLIVLTIL